LAAKPQLESQKLLWRMQVIFGSEDRNKKYFL